MASFFWSVPFVPAKVVVSDASSTGCGALIQGSSLVYHRNWSTEESSKPSLKVFDLNGALCRLKFVLDAF